MSRDVAPDAAWTLGSDAYEPTAIYFSDSDCVEYVVEATIPVYDRIDDFLTLIYDDTVLRPIGFKLKGFGYWYGKSMRPLHQLDNQQYIKLVSAIEWVAKELGDDLFKDHERVAAYQAARKLAEGVKLQYEPQAACG